MSFFRSPRAFRELRGIADREDLVADRVQHGPVMDPVARPDDHRQADHAADQRRGDEGTQREPGPIQAPRPAINLTSPAPIPPIAYSGQQRDQAHRHPRERPEQLSRPPAKPA